MSGTTEPITAVRFAAALQELPLSSLFAKGAEIRNNIAHLYRSNEELKTHAEAGDGDCADAAEENMAVISRMRTRLELLQAEVEARGLNWDESPANEVNRQSIHDSSGADINAEVVVHSTTNSAERGTRESNNHIQAAPHGNSGGRLDDDELRRLIAERIDEAEDHENAGLHL